MIIDQIDVMRVAFIETECNAPVATDCHGPDSLSLPVEFVQPIGGNGKINHFSRIEREQDAGGARTKRCFDITAVPFLEQELQASVLEARDHSISV